MGEIASESTNEETQMGEISLSEKNLDDLDSERERENLKKVEAVLFISGRFLSIQELISYTDFEPTIIRELIGKLKEKYDSEDSSIEIVENNNLWKMDVKREYSEIINKFATGSGEFSKAEQGTLAIIAYKHPIKQSVVIRIRGNKAYDHIKKFSELGFLKKKKVGHTHELSLSEGFHDYFNTTEQ